VIRELEGGAALNNMRQGDKKVGVLSIFCGIWTIILGLLFLISFIFSWFDIGEGYAKVGWLYSQIADNINLIANILGIIILGSCIILIAGGITLISNKQKKGISTVGLCGVYFYFLCLGVMIVALFISAGPARSTGTLLVWLGACIFLLIPNILLLKMLIWK